MLTDDEKDRALCEAHCNSAADEYFNSRPQIDSQVNRRIFCAGHRKAWLQQVEATAPLLARIAELEKALNGLLAIRNDSQGVVGYHLNGNTADWDEFPEVAAAESAISAAPAAQPDKVLVDLDVLEAAADSLGSFCSDHGWSDADMQNLDNLLAFIAQHKAKHGIKEQP